MKLLFKQRMFSWFDSYDIFDEAGNTVYTIKGQLGWGHVFKVFDATGRELGMVRQKIWTWLPQFELYRDGVCIGTISKKFTFFRPEYEIDYRGWYVKGSFLEWDYSIYDNTMNVVAVITKELLNWTDTYSIDVVDPEDGLTALMFVLAIDAEKCSRNN